MNDFNVWIGHVLSLGAIVVTLLGWLPPVAAIAALIWYAIQIAESKTVQGFLRRRRHRKLVKLKLEIERLAAENE